MYTDFVYDVIDSKPEDKSSFIDQLIQYITKRVVSKISAYDDKKDN